MKKALCIALAFVIIIASTILTFAEAQKDVSNEVNSLIKIGMLEGDGSGISIDYTKKEMDRITAAISILKLRGLYEDALNYKGSSNFADANEIKWDEGRNILAYIKTKNIFSGNEKGEFMPYDKINEASYYKVLLETLGYKQILGKAAGDFTWDQTLEFSKKIGLEPSGSARFTIDDLAKATVSALKARNKSGKQYIASLIDAKKIDKQKAIEAGLYEEPPAMIKSVKPLGNTVLEVTFKSDNPRKISEDISRYYIEGLEIKGVTYIDGDTVRINTSSQKPGESYHVVFEGSSVKYKAIARVTDAPGIKSIESNEIEKIVIEFDKELDYSSATDTHNYVISGVDIVNAELMGKKVTLETSGLAAKKTYTLKFRGIKSVDGVSLWNLSKSFTSNADVDSPVLVRAESQVLSQNEIQLAFKDESKFDEATLFDPNNYSAVTNDRYKDEASVMEVKKVSYKSGLYKLKLIVEDLKHDTSYLVTVHNIADEYGNVLEKNNTITFRTQPPAPEVYSMYQLNDRSFVMEMSTEVIIIDSDKKVAAGGTNFTMRVDSLNKTLVRFNAEDKIIEGKEYSFDLSKLIASNKGIAAKNLSSKKTVFVGEFGDIEKPYIYDVIKVDSLTVEVQYSEDMKTAGTYSIKYMNDKGIIKTLSILGYETSGSIVTIKLSSATPMEDEYEYFLILKTLAKDMAGNSSNHKTGEEFVITD